MGTVLIGDEAQTSVMFGCGDPINASRPRWTELTGRGDRLHQRTHLLGPPLLDMAERHRHHHRQDHTDTGGHLGDAADEMLLEAEVAADPVVDALESAATVVSPAPTGTPPRGEDEDASIVLF